VRQGLAQVYTWTGEPNLALQIERSLLAVPAYFSYSYFLHDPA